MEEDLKSSSSRPETFVVVLENGAAVCVHCTREQLYDIMKEQDHNKIINRFWRHVTSYDIPGKHSFSTDYTADLILNGDMRK